MNNENSSIKHLIEKIDSFESLKDKKKIIWNWIKQGTINFKEFSEVIDYIEKETNNESV